MTETSSQEAIFFRHIREFQVISDTSHNWQNRLDQWREGLVNDIGSHSFQRDGLQESNGLVKQAAQLQQEIGTAIKDWTNRWDELGPARELAERYGDKVVLLVFGKVNAGKSSFCNFLVDRFKSSGKSADYFYLDQGKIHSTDERFVEGITETTSRIQGVHLDEERLILLDTPGLHSIKGENGLLTKRFTESADAVLWLTSSASPGQVQELEELQSELSSKKPLLPVITKSDRYEDDEVDGEIVTSLLNKSASNRAEQEQDVFSRSSEKLERSGLDTQLLKHPVSVSAHAAREYYQTPQAMEDAGFPKLYGNLSLILEEALSYKRNKSFSVFMDYIEKTIIKTLNDNVIPRLDEMKEASHAAQENLSRQQQQMISESTREVLLQLPSLLHEHQATKNVQAVCKELSTNIHRSIADQVANALADYAVSLDESMANLSPGDNLDFEDRVVDVKKKKGAAIKTLLSTGAALGGFVAGAKGGALVGTAIAPGPGTAIGGFVGGILGSIITNFAGDKIGEAVIDGTEIQKKVVGVSYERLLAELESEVRSRIPTIVGKTIQECTKSIQAVCDEVARMKYTIEDHKNQLEDLKESLTHERD